MAASCLYATERARASSSGPGRVGEEEKVTSTAVGGAVRERSGSTRGGEEGGVLSARVITTAMVLSSDGRCML